jgi:hypothetical protein
MTSTDIERRLNSLPLGSATFKEPMECLAVPKLPNGSQWVYQIKLDGYRAIAVKSSGKLNLFSRRRNPFNRQYSLVLEALADLPDNTIVDGEVVALNESGRPDFNLLQHYRAQASRIHYFVFDLLVYKNSDLTRLPLVERHEIMKSLLFFRSGLQRISYDPRHVRVEMLKTQAFFLQRNFLKVLKCTAMTRTIFAAIALLLVSAAPQDQTPNARPRASDLGLKVGVLPTGPLDAITDVAGVEVGHTTIIRGDDIRTGVTATLPHSGTNRSIGIPSSKLPGLMLKIRFMQP